MVRGSQTLFKDIFPIEAPEKQRKGRSIAYDILRNECLINSYWFIGNETGLRFELIIKIVARQFWISQRTVSNILQFNHHLLVNVRKERPTKSQLKKKWPHLSWETPDLKDYL